MLTDWAKAFGTQLFLGGRATLCIDPQEIGRLGLCGLVRIITSFLLRLLSLSTFLGLSLLLAALPSHSSGSLEFLHGLQIRRLQVRGLLLKRCLCIGRHR